jgi:hypothetical protein
MMTMMMMMSNWSVASADPFTPSDDRTHHWKNSRSVRVRGTKMAQITGRRDAEK